MLANHSSPRDLGLQPERTGLAWRRTAVLLVVVALLLSRMDLRTGGSVDLTAVLIAAAVRILAYGRG